MIPSEETMRALVGHHFPGGTYRIEHWENVLFSEATGIEPLPNHLAHQASLFHVAINGVGTNVGELFALAESEPADAAVSIGYYDWYSQQPLEEERTYSLAGGITEFERSVRRSGATRDSFTYEIEIDDIDGERVAEVAFQWHFWRTGDEAPKR